MIYQRASRQAIMERTKAAFQLCDLRYIYTYVLETHFYILSVIVNIPTLLGGWLIQISQHM